VTLVPDDPGQGTSDHGWDIVMNNGLLKDVIGRLHAGGMRVSLFVDPDPYAPDLAKSVGADRVEIYTGPYGGALELGLAKRELDRVVAAGRAAERASMRAMTSRAPIFRRWLRPCPIWPRSRSGMPSSPMR
jgi:pyridoxine 5-phosphate synthase